MFAQEWDLVHTFQKTNTELYQQWAPKILEMLAMEELKFHPDYNISLTLARND